MITNFQSPEHIERHTKLIHNWKTKRCASALQALIADYQPLFRTEIKRALRGQTLSADHEADLMQECIQCLISALDAFDPKVCPSLTPYLSRHIKGVVHRYVLDFRSAYRLGTSSDDRRAYYAAQRLRAHRLQTGQTNLLDHDIDTVAQNSATSRTVAARAVAAISGGHVSLDTIEADIADPLGDSAHILSEKDAIAKAMSAFKRHLATLPERTRTIVCETIMGHKTKDAVTRMALRYNITPRRVRQIQSEGLMTIRTLMENESLTIDAIF